MNLLKSLDSIFTKRIFRIPDYQRGYAWQPDQLKDFWEDLINLPIDRSHYAGVLTIRELGKDETKSDSNEYWLVNSSYKIYEIVDGQQRLTTFVIFIQAFVEFYRKTNENRNKADDKIFILDSIDLTKVIESFLYKIKPTGVNFRTYKFGYTEDNPSYEFLRYRIFNESGTGEIQETFYTLNLEYSKKFFLKQLERYYENYSLKGLDELYKKITQLFLFNEYVIDDEFDVFVAFETMNNRGKKLSDLELLKNRLIYLTTLFPDDLGKDDRAHLRREINDAWREVYHQLGRNKEHPLNDDDFLKAHWIMYFKYSRRRGNDYIKFLMDEQFSPKRIYIKSYFEIEGYKAIEQRAFETDDDDDDIDSPIYESTQNSSFEKIDANEISSYVKSLRESAVHWFNTFYPTDSDLSDSEKNSLHSLNRVGVGYFRPLVMSILKNENNSESRQKIFGEIERFIFIAFRLSQTRSNYQDSVFYNAARELEHSEISLENIREKINYALADYFDSEGNFKINSFAEFINSKFTRGDKTGYYNWYGLHYFLYEYELSLYKKNGRKAVVTWDVLKNTPKDKISIEHIYPQTPNNDYWNSKFPIEQSTKSFYQGSLGNLLLLSSAINSSLQNDSFDEKKKEKVNDKGAKIRSGYREGSYSEIEVSTNEEWTPEKIKDRGMSLLKFMQGNWKIKFHADQVQNDLLTLKLLNLPE